MKLKFEIDMPDGIDMEHALESLSDAMYYADCVTAKEQDFVIKILQAIQKQIDHGQSTEPN
jgi:hypothetical protein